MICPNCNSEINSNNFCTKCGTPLMNNNMLGNNSNINLTITREKNPIGSIISFPVFIDNNKLGELKNGKSLSCNLTPGRHIITFKMTEKQIVQEINITSTNNSVELICIAKMGLLTALPKIKDIIYR